ncbi:MAG: alpha/beta fold hydrolase [Bacteroidia bacterium]
MKLAYREFGQGQPLLILHGLFGQSDNWNTLARRFGENGFHVFTIDQRNHGLSPHSDTWTYEAMADDLKEFIDDHHLEKPVILGHSMGGKTVMFFELKYPGVADKIIVADISPRAYGPHHDDVLDGLNSVDFLKIKTRKEADAALSAFISDFGTKQFLLKNIYWKDSDANVMDWRFNLAVITREYPNIGIEVPEQSSNVKSLFMRGEKSNYIADKDIPEIEKRFPNYRLVTIKDAGHWIHAEKPDAFYEDVMEFITA